MKERDRLQRNIDRLAECYPTFAERLKIVIDGLEQDGFRPRIQDAWRSLKDQRTAYAAGTSKVRYGLHNVTGANNEKESLAADVLDDDKPLEINYQFVIALCRYALNNGLLTGITFGLPKNLKKAVLEAATTNSSGTRLKIGWDPNHVQVAGISIKQAKEGRRPK